MGGGKREIHMVVTIQRRRRFAGVCSQMGHIKGHMGEEVHRGVFTYGSQYRSCGDEGEGDSYGYSNTDEKGDF